jgi:alpha-1,2-mannosyltransferase
VCWGRGVRLVSSAGLTGLTAVYIASAAACCALASKANADFVDLHVYRTGAAAVLNGEWLYGVRYLRLPFTYPPFAAAAFTALAAVPWTLAASAMLVASAVAVPAAFYLAMRLRPISGWLTRTDAARLALAVSVLAVWLEPIRSTLGFGQVNIILTAMILFDLALPDSSRFKGLAIGIAAGIKLTPIIFAVYLLATRRYRAGATAGAAFAATVAVGYAVVPAASEYFYGDLYFRRPERISPVYNDWNQSLLGALTRDLGHQPGQLWMVAIALVALAGLGLAALAGRRGDEATGFGLCAVTGLLVSPITWTHHWVIALPALLLAGIVAWRRRPEYPRRAVAWLSGIFVLVVIAAAELVRREPRMPLKAQLHLSPFWLAVSQIYVAAGLAVLAIAAGPYVSRWVFGQREADRWTASFASGSAAVQSRGPAVASRNGPRPTGRDGSDPAASVQARQRHQPGGRPATVQELIGPDD